MKKHIVDKFYMSYGTNNLNFNLDENFKTNHCCHFLFFLVTYEIYRPVQLVANYMFGWESFNG